MSSPTEHHELTDAFGHGVSQGILGESRANRDEQAQAAFGLVRLGVIEQRLRVNAEDAQRQGVGKDPTMFQNLMHGAKAGVSKAVRSAVPTA